MALIVYLNIRPLSSAFCSFDANNKPITRNFLAEHIKKLIALSGNDPNDFNCISLRAGRTTVLACEGVPEAIIKHTGRWSSNAFQRYIRFGAFTLPR